MVLALWSCGTSRGPQPAEPVHVSVADFQTLRWLEGSWRGTEQGRNPFYERYQFESDTLVRIHYLADSTAVQTANIGSVYLSGGVVYHEAGGGRWRAVRMDSTRIDFAPAERVTNAFTWARESGDAWVATLHNPGAVATVYRLERLSP